MYKRQNGELKKDERWNLLKEFTRLIRELNPDIVSMENVPLLEKQGVFRRFKNSIKKDGYEIEYRIVDCAEYGIPQKRRRLVLLASKIGKISLPNIKTKQKTVKDAIKGLPKIKAGSFHKKDPIHLASNLIDLNLERIRLSKPGGTWRDWPEELRAECHRKKTGSTYSSVYARMEWNKPSPTITTQFYRFGTGRFGHPTQDRALSLREGAILQTFPKEYKFVEKENNFSSVRLGIHIGNAVPPKLQTCLLYTSPSPRD